MSNQPWSHLVCYHTHSDVSVLFYWWVNSPNISPLKLLIISYSPAKSCINRWTLFTQELDFSYVPMETPSVAYHSSLTCLAIPQSLRLSSGSGPTSFFSRWVYDPRTPSATFDLPYLIPHSRWWSPSPSMLPSSSLNWDRCTSSPMTLTCTMTSLTALSFAELWTSLRI